MRLHSGDSLGTGAAYAASVACAEEALLRREAASEAKRPKGPQGAALMRTECHAAFRAPLRALRFARALDCFAICAGSLRNAYAFLRRIWRPSKAYLSLRPQVGLRLDMQSRERRRLACF